MTENNRINFLRTKRAKILLIGLAIILFFSLYIPVPYFITMPGTAIELKSIVDVEDGYKEKGDLMLTTVSMMHGTLPTYIYSYFSSYMETIPDEYILSADENEEDYSKRQIKVMSQSQDNAIISAFHYLNLPISIKDKGIIVMGLIPKLPAEKILKVGDIITRVDHVEIHKTDDLLEYLAFKNEGDHVQVSFLRNGTEHKEDIPLVNLVENMEGENLPDKKIGIGFLPFDEREVIPSKKVKFNTENIGGPSAGLMFTLEIINQLTSNDLTMGHKIAGTGTIDDAGNVGQIGGARLKVKAAYEKGAEIFFVPRDIEADDVNQKDAEQSNKDLGSPLTIVPVTNLKEAMEYLKNL